MITNGPDCSGLKKKGIFMKKIIMGALSALSLFAQSAIAEVRVVQILHDGTPVPLEKGCCCDQPCVHRSNARVSIVPRESHVTVVPPAEPYMTVEPGNPMNWIWPSSWFNGSIPPRVRFHDWRDNDAAYIYRDNYSSPGIGNQPALNTDIYSGLPGHRNNLVPYGHYQPPTQSYNTDYWSDSRNHGGDHRSYGGDHHQYRSHDSGRHNNSNHHQSRGNDSGRHHSGSSRSHR